MTDPETYETCFGHYIDFLNKNWKFNAEMIKFIFEKREQIDELFLSPVSGYYWEAVRCFLTGNYTGSIAAISASVEYAINNENRKHGWGPKPEGWLELYCCLKLAKSQGLPADKLLEAGFHKTRNSFDHGDIFPLISRKHGLADFGNPNFAIEQLILATDFLIALYDREQPKIYTERERPVT